MSISSLIPKARSDRIALSFTLLACTIVPLVCLFGTLPAMLGEWNSIVRMSIYSLLCYMMFCSFANLYFVLSIDTTCRSMILPATLQSEWSFCPSCEANSPPRATHCYTCKTCVLKREHHCSFTGTCIGLKNHRYFLVFLLHVCLGAILCAVNITSYMWQYHLMECSYSTILYHVTPLLFYLMGYFDTKELGYTLLTSLPVVGGLFVAALFMYHLNLVLHGQTVKEKGKGERRYDLGWKQNLVETFGEKYILVWFNPFAYSQLPSTGLSFSTTANWQFVGRKVR